MRGWFIVLGILLFTGCASAVKETATDLDIPIEKINSNIVRIGVVVVEPIDSDVQVRGAVVLKPGYRRSMPRSVRVEVLDASGNIVHVANAALLRSGVRSRTARFAIDLDIEPERISRLRIVHQPGG